jgi:hypothetical protein
MVEPGCARVNRYWAGERLDREGMNSFVEHLIRGTPDDK